MRNRRKVATALAVAAIGGAVVAEQAAAHDFTGCVRGTTVENFQPDFPQAGPVTYTVGANNRVTATWQGDGFRATKTLPTCPPVTPPPPPPPVEPPPVAPPPDVVPPRDVTPPPPPVQDLSCAALIEKYPGAGPVRRAAWGCPTDTIKKPPPKITFRVRERVIRKVVCFTPANPRRSLVVIERITSKFRDGKLVVSRRTVRAERGAVCAVNG